MNQSRRLEIVSVGMYVPEQVWDNAHLATMMTNSDEWIQTRTGIKKRHIASPEQTTSELGIKAAEEAIAKAGMQPSDIDLILACTLSPDYYFPGIGVQIQDGLGINGIPALDLRGQCAGFSWALTTAEAYAQQGRYKNILIVGAEIHSKVIHWDDDGKDIAVLFGDGAGAVVLSAKEGERAQASNQHAGLIDFEMGSDGSGIEHLAMRRPGMKGDARFVTHADIDGKTCHPKMDGKQVFKNAVDCMAGQCRTLMQRNGLTPDDIDLIVPHQANQRILDAIAQRLEMDPEKVVSIISDYGNTTAATIPLALYRSIQDGRLQKGKLIIIVSFGAGFAWGANLVRW